MSSGEGQNSRRKRIIKEGQALPLFLSAARSRVSERVVMSAVTSRELQRYLRWASAAAGLGRDEAQVMLLDRAIGDYMKRDEAWQVEKGAAGVADDEASAAHGQDRSAPMQVPAPARPSVQPSPPRAPDTAEGGPAKATDPGAGKGR